MPSVPRSGPTDPACPLASRRSGCWEPCAAARAGRWAGPWGQQWLQAGLKCPVALGCGSQSWGEAKPPEQTNGGLETNSPPSGS